MTNTFDWIEIKTKGISQAVLFFIVMVALTSCSSLSTTPTSTPLPTSTTAPTQTSTSPPTLTPTPPPTVTPSPSSTATLEPSATPAPTETEAAFGLPMPSGTPQAAWQGFPIMPEALAGEGDSSSYSFTVMATVEEVQAFYDQELPKLGYEPFASGQNDSGTMMLMYMKDMKIVTVSIIPQSDGIVYVMLVK